MAKDGGSSETTREGFCFDLFVQIATIELTAEDRRFLEFFIGFFEAEGSFLVWPGESNKGNRMRVAFGVGQKDPTVIHMIQSFFGFGKVNPAHSNEWRWEIEERVDFLKLVSVFAGNIALVKRQEQFQKLMDAAEAQEEQLPVPDDLKAPIFKELCNRVSMFFGKSLITFNNGWLAGFWQGDGGFYPSDTKGRFNVVLRASQDGEEDTMNHLSVLITGSIKKISKLTNNKTKKEYNRVDSAALNALHNLLISYFAEFQQSEVVWHKR